MFPCTSWERPSFTFYPMKTDHVFGKKYHLSRLYKKDHVPALPFLEKPSFQRVWRKYHISMYLLRKITFIFCLRCKIIYSGKRIITFPDNISDSMFQCNFFGKTIFWVRCFSVVSNAANFFTHSLMICGTGVKTPPPLHHFNPPVLGNSSPISASSRPPPSYFKAKFLSDLKLKFYRWV